MISLELYLLVNYEWKSGIAKIVAQSTTLHISFPSFRSDNSIMEFNFGKFSAPPIDASETI